MTLKHRQNLDGIEAHPIDDSVVALHKLASSALRELGQSAAEAWMVRKYLGAVGRA